MKRRIIYLAGILLGGVVLTAHCVQAGSLDKQNDPPSDLIRSVTAQALSELISHKGIKNEVLHTEVEDSMIRVSFPDAKAFILFRDCKNNQCKSIQILSFPRGQTVSQTQINKWNRNAAFAGAYINPDGRAGIAADIYVGNGVALDNLAACVTRFGQALKKFIHDIYPAKEPGKGKN